MLGKAKWLILAIFMTLPLSALAMTGYHGDVVILEESEVINHNYYAAGNFVEIKGTVNGDVFVAGDTVVINSENINGDIFAAASNVDVVGQVNGSLRLVGEKINIDAQVDGNAMVAGQNFRISDGSLVSGNVTFFGQMLNVSGQVSRLEGAVASLVLTGTVDNDVDIYLGESSDSTLNISNEAVVGGTFYYQAIKELDINSQASISEVAYNKIIKKDYESGVEKFSVLAWLWKFFGMLVVGMVLLYMWPSIFEKSYRTVYKKPIARFFQGFALLVLTPIFCILLAITVIGIPISIITMILWGLSLYLAGILAAWILGNFIKEKWLAKYKWSKLWVFAFGLFVYILIAKLPYLGPIFTGIIYLMAWGAIFRVFKKSKQTK